MQRWKIAGISFDHMHMGDNLRMAKAHPQVEIVGLWDTDSSKAEGAAKELGLRFRGYDSPEDLIREQQPDLVILCPATARHAEWVERIAPFGTHILMEKPFAASLVETDRMMAAMEESDKLLAINWPLVWVPAHRTARRLIREGVIGEVIEVHYYGGNRGPLWHLANKEETTADWVQTEKPRSWFYSKEHGGGSLLDYLGYGATLGTWFRDNQMPLEVTAVVDQPAGLEVDEHSITICRYEKGLSKFETRWGTFTDPWKAQTQPRCGFVLVGSSGTICSYDYRDFVEVQTADCPQGKNVPVDTIPAPFQNPVQYLIECIEKEKPLDGPLSLSVSRLGQRIVDAAYTSATQRRTVALSEFP